MQQPRAPTPDADSAGKTSLCTWGLTGRSMATPAQHRRCLPHCCTHHDSSQAADPLRCPQLSGTARMGWEMYLMQHQLQPRSSYTLRQVSADSS